MIRSGGLLLEFHRKIRDLGRNMKLYYDESVHHHLLGVVVASLLNLLPILSPPFMLEPLGFASPSMLSEWNPPRSRHPSLLLSAAISRQPQQPDLWSPLPDEGWRPCITNSFSDFTKSNVYIQFFLDGGLNQQRIGICDAVAVAKILNATLVIPFLELNPVWNDPSSFMEIFDVDHFIKVLKNDISIVQHLPPEFSWSTREYYSTGIRATRVKTAPFHASSRWYLYNVLPVLHKYKIAAISPFSHRLTFENLPSHLQLLRCKTNFEALVFVSHIRSLGDTLINRLRTPDPLDEQTPKKFAVVHLRFDKDMAAHSSCDFGGGRAEKSSLAKYRRELWRGKSSVFTEEEVRKRGRCPLTPEEIGLVMAGLGFQNSTPLYLASHRVYGGEARVSALKSLFPFVEDKRSLASNEERRMVEGRASLLAALDYYVSIHGDVFISASPGNMHNSVLGYRRYMNLKSIRPNMPFLARVFMNRSLNWDGFQSSVFDSHVNRQGNIRVRKPHQSIYTYPSPDCLCQRS